MWEKLFLYDKVDNARCVVFCTLRIADSIKTVFLQLIGKQLKLII